MVDWSGAEPRPATVMVHAPFDAATAVLLVTAIAELACANVTVTVLPGSAKPESVKPEEDSDKFKKPSLSWAPES